MKICRDDLRYTDDVIATLQSVHPTSYIAKALNISEEDVLYHCIETHGMSHNGTVLPITEEYFDGYPQFSYSRNCKSNVLPLDAEYYASHTVKQICDEFNLSDSTVRNFVLKFGYKTRRAIRPSTYHNRWRFGVSYETRHVMPVFRHSIFGMLMLSPYALYCDAG